jgi:hypothetical protein
MRQRYRVFVTLFAMVALAALVALRTGLSLGFLAI